MSRRSFYKRRKRLRHIIFFISINLFTNAQKPRVSIITSVFNGDAFIEGFFQDIIRQTIFNQSELIIINANSPGKEDAVIKKYAQKYKNITYKKLDNDPGLYAVWNIAIKMAKSDLITNANLDDRRNPEFLEIQVQELEKNLGIDLVYSDFYITELPNETFEKNRHCMIRHVPEFYEKVVQFSTQGPQPLWRKSIHKACGYFNERFTSSGDWEMWCRAVSYGCKFKKVPGLSGLFYWNPNGLSTNGNIEKINIRKKEDDYIARVYGYIWQTEENSDLLNIKINVPNKFDITYFFNNLHEIYQKLSGKFRYRFFLNIDENQYDYELIEKLKLYPNLKINNQEVKDNTKKIEIGLFNNNLKINFDLY